jgi:hypothetical protein
MPNRSFQRPGLRPPLKLGVRQIFSERSSQVHDVMRNEG